ncbi:hypothetical protein B0H17DRAFT_1115927 [Mycena rosella]|uniref:Uncharacterized protein n=1 Tax=Mycena rosella TaxID=1033263 RepID=A0AAD7B9Y8_MYCRO|nr:hypothetical protein B0H17DRAFT_1115927 [Mycena rosella]
MAPHIKPYVLIAVLLLHRRVGCASADLVPPSAAIPGSFSVGYPPYDRQFSTTISGQSSISASSSISRTRYFSRIFWDVNTLLPPSPTPANTAHRSKFVNLLDNPAIVAGLVLRRDRQRWRNFIAARKLSPSPDAYTQRPRRSTFLRPAANPSLRIPARITLLPPPRTSSRPPLIARSATLQSVSVSAIHSSDVHQVQREFRGFSLRTQPFDPPASPSSIGTIRVLPIPSSQTLPTPSVQGGADMDYTLLSGKKWVTEGRVRI